MRLSDQGLSSLVLGLEKAKIFLIGSKGERGQVVSVFQALC